MHCTFAALRLNPLLARPAARLTSERETVLLPHLALKKSTPFRLPERRMLGPKGLGPFPRGLRPIGPGNNCCLGRAWVMQW